MSNFAPKRTDYDAGDRRWQLDPHKSETHGVTVELADVTADSAGYVKSGSLVAGEGLVVNDFTIKAGEKHDIAVHHAGPVDRRLLPVALTAAQEASLRTVSFLYGTVPA